MLFISFLSCSLFNIAHLLKRKRRVCGLRFSPARQIAGSGVDAAGVRGSQVAEMRPFDFAQGGLSTSRTKTCPFTPTSRAESTRLTDSIGYEGPTEMTVTSGLVTDKELPRYRTLRRFSLLIRETLPSQPVDLILGDFATTSILAQCLDYQTHIQKPLNCFPEPGPSCKG